MIDSAKIEALQIWLEGIEYLPGVTDEERDKARKVLKSAGLSLEQVERGGMIHTLRKTIDILTEESNEHTDPAPDPGSQDQEI